MKCISHALFSWVGVQTSWDLLWYLKGADQCVCVLGHLPVKKCLCLCFRGAHVMEKTLSAVCSHLKVRATGNEQLGWYGQQRHES